MNACIDRSFLHHCLALARLARVRGPVVARIARGAELWRALCKWEARADRLALRLCNGPEFGPGEVERKKARIVAGVLSVLGRRRLPGLFVNLDPRGYSLKIEAAGNLGSGLHMDWGGFLVLAPYFGGRS